MAEPGVVKSGLKSEQGQKNFSDSFLSALVFITAHFGHARSADSLITGLPVAKDGMTPKQFCEAAAQAAFKARIVKKNIRNVPPEVFPVVVVKKSKAAVVVVQKGERGQLRVYDPATQQDKLVSAEELAREATDYTIYIKPDLEQEQGPAARNWFWSTVSESTDVYINVLIASLLINIFALTGPIFIMNFYNRVLPSDAVETGWALALGAAAVFIFDFIIKVLRAYFIDVAGRRADVIVAQKLYNQVLDMRLGARKGSTGAFANTMREFDSLREFFNSATVTGLVDFPFSLLFIAAIWIIADVRIAMLLLVLYVIVLAVGYVMQIPVRGKVQQAMKTAEQKHGLLVETIGSIETIRGVMGEGALRAAYSRYVGMAAEAGQQSRFYSGLSVHFSAFISQFSTVLIVLLGMYLIRDKDITVGALIACVLLSSRAIAPIGTVAGLVNKYHHARSAFRSLDTVMRLPVERPRDKKFLHRPVLTGEFQFRDVEFSYPRAGRPALQKINLVVKAGEKVAIVGRIGSGKSTIVKMMVNFYEPGRGAILADGTDMRQIDPADLRRNIAYMGQDTVLMSGTVRENIVMGRPHASDADVLRVAELAGVHDFMRRHPMGYDAPLGERGEGLSDGQQQTVALARTLLTDAPVMILDEPTNSMDTGTEEKVLRNLEGVIRDKTVIFVTHKPALLRLVTRLIVMDGGQIVMDGPRDQVLQALASEKVTAAQS